jgi:hypothetical protein
MRTLRILILLAVAGMAWKKLLQPRLPAAKAQLAKTRDRVEPALHKAADDVRSASKHALESARDMSLSAAETAEVVRDATLSAAETADSVATAMMAPEGDPADATATQGSAPSQ